jgi:hypothetical protein
MSDRQFERAVIDWLEDGSDRTPRRSIDAVLLAVKTTPQERDLRIPWRTPRMPALSRATGLAAAAVVAVIGAGALFYLGSGKPAGNGGPAATVSPTPTAAGATAPGIPGWTAYTSTVYGVTFSYPSDWDIHAPAEHKWRSGEPVVSDAWPWADTFASPDPDGSQIGLWYFQVAAPKGADLASWDGLEAAVRAVCSEPTILGCPAQTGIVRMCAGQVPSCKPALIFLNSTEGNPNAFIADPGKGVLTVFQLGRPDAYPSAARYGGAMALLKAILTQVDVRVPQAGETPH